MKQTLSEIWRNIGVYSKEVSAQSEEEKELLKALSKHRTEINKKINDLDLLDQLESCYNGILDIECENAFIKGFSMATKMIYEALDR